MRWKHQCLWECEVVMEVRRRRNVGGVGDDVTGVSVASESIKKKPMRLTSDLVDRSVRVSSQRSWLEESGDKSSMRI